MTPAPMSPAAPAAPTSPAAELPALHRRPAAAPGREGAVSVRVTEVEWDPDCERVDDLDDRGEPYYCEVRPRAGATPTGQEPAGQPSRAGAGEAPPPARAAAGGAAVRAGGLAFPLAVVLLGLASVTAGEPPAPAKAPAGVRYLPDVTYRTFAAAEGGGELQLDLACPAEGDGPFPAVVCLHGGGWVKGSRKTTSPMLFALARRGYVAVGVSYRFAPAHRFPAQVHDAKAAVRWLRAHADRYRVDKGRVGVLGYSSGGHLAALLGETATDPALEGDGGNLGESSRVQAVVSYYGPADLRGLHEACGDGRVKGVGAAALRWALEGFVGGPPAEAGPRYAAASPAARAGRGAAPALLIHGTADTLIPADQSKLLARRLREAAAEAELLLLEGAGHAFAGEHEARADAAALDFLDRHLKGPRGGIVPPNSGAAGPPVGSLLSHLSR